MALGPCHYLANLLDHRYLGSTLSEKQKAEAYDYLSSVNADLIPFVTALQCKDSGDIFPAYLFKHCFLSVSLMTHWNIAIDSVMAPDDQMQQEKLRKQINSLCSQLFSAMTSTAGLERIFSTYELVHSKLRNKLRNTKAAKLAFLFISLNQTTPQIHQAFHVPGREEECEQATCSNTAVSAGQATQNTQ